MAVQYYVVGSGSIGRRHHGNLQALGAEAHLLGWRGLDLATLEALIGGAESAAVVIATATQVRLELIEICGRLGVPFFVEKPLAFRMGELEQIYRAAAPVAERSMVGFMMRYHPALRALVQEPVGGAYGFALEIGHDVRQWRQNWSFGESYAAKSEGGGVLLDLCHEVDMAHCLFPEARVQAVESIGHADFPGVDFATRVTLAQGGGPVGSVAMDYLSPKSLRRMSIRGAMRCWTLIGWSRRGCGQTEVTTARGAGSSSATTCFLGSWVISWRWLKGARGRATR
ncbi:hypothetical protein N4R57_21655 [Rhodobacteraceae bacterium D3-12]|nr:hypothetical protein N4R57_21655 [Rhodobacteraceae bacterium D3-12]